MFIALYSFALLAALALSSPWWLAGMLRGGRYREGVWQRLGRVPGDLVAADVWVHAVSVGEVLAAARLVNELQTQGLRLAVSTTTQAGQRLAREKFGSARVFYFPLDFAFAVRAWLRVVRPRIVVLMESELWPRFLMECERAGVPVVVVNARVSDRSFPRYMKLRKLWRPLLGRIRLILAQSEEDAQRWCAIGAERVECVGNLKYDVRAAGETDLVRDIREALPHGIPVLVAGSTLEGEEVALLDCDILQDAVLVLAPRHPQRFDAVDRLLRDRSVNCIRLGAWRAVNDPGVRRLKPGATLLVDSIGDLASLYQLGTVAFVGGSIVDAGGHNPLEPAQWGVPIIMGPYYSNFRTMVDTMREQNAVRITSQHDLCSVLTAAVQNPDTAMGERGRAFFLSQAGATARTLARLQDILEQESKAVRR